MATQEQTMRRSATEDQASHDGVEAARPLPGKHEADDNSAPHDITFNLPSDSTTTVGLVLPEIAVAPPDAEMPAAELSRRGFLPDAEPGHQHVGVPDKGIASDNLDPSPFGEPLPTMPPTQAPRRPGKAIPRARLARSPAELAPPAVWRRSSLIPAHVPQQTFAEVRAVAAAIADAPTLRDWRPLPDGIGLKHVRSGWTVGLRTEFIPGPALRAQWSDSPASEILQATLKTSSLDCILLLHLLLVLVREHGQVTVSLAELAAAIGERRPRGETERADLFARLWNWLLVLDSLHVVGRRAGKYPAPGNPGRFLDLHTYGPLIRLSAEPAGLGRGGEAVPSHATVVAGAWLEPLRGNVTVLQSFGDIRRLVSLPRKAGPWARGVGLSLQQRWREDAQNMQAVPMAANGQMIIGGCKRLTRRDLLSLFRVSPDYEKLLRGPNPYRAVGYWEKAVAELQGLGLISPDYKDPPQPNHRKQWQDEWLDQPLDLRPAPAGLAAVPGLRRTIRLADEEFAGGKTPTAP
jgi:hypothetical protein